MDGSCLHVVTQSEPEGVARHCQDPILDIGVKAPRQLRDFHVARYLLRPFQRPAHWQRAAQYRREGRARPFRRSGRQYRPPPQPPCSGP